MVKVLVADDHPMFRAGVDRLVKRAEGMELVASVEDGRAALEGIKTHLPDIAVLDINMPGMSGTQVLNELAIEGIQTRVIVLSGHLDSPTIQAAMLSGAAACIAKDSGPDKLRDTLARVAAGETIVPPELSWVVQQRAAQQASTAPAAAAPPVPATPELSSPAAPPPASAPERVSAVGPVAAAMPAPAPSALGGSGGVRAVAPILGVAAVIAIIAVVALSGGGGDDDDGATTPAAPVTQTTPAEDPVETAPQGSDPGELPEGISR